MPEEERRFEKTIEKIRRTGLPGPTTLDVRQLVAGDGTQCDGCGEAISLREDLHQVNVRGVLTLRFHDVCYSAWSTYKPDD
jgi:hypothetical protein